MTSREKQINSQLLTEKAKRLVCQARQTLSQETSADAGELNRVSVMMTKL